MQIRTDKELEHATTVLRRLTGQIEETEKALQAQQLDAASITRVLDPLQSQRDAVQEDIDEFTKEMKYLIAVRPQGRGTTHYFGAIHDDRKSLSYQLRDQAERFHTRDAAAAKIAELRKHVADHRFGEEASSECDSMYVQRFRVPRRCLVAARLEVTPRNKLITVPSCTFVTTVFLDTEDLVSLKQQIMPLWDKSKFSQLWEQGDWTRATFRVFAGYNYLIHADADDSLAVEDIAYCEKCHAPKTVTMPGCESCRDNGMWHLPLNYYTRSTNRSQ